MGSRLAQRLRVRNGPWLTDLLLFLSWLALRFLPLNLRALARLGPARLYILHECSQYPAVAIARRIHRVPFIYDAHDFYSGIEPEAELPSVDRRFIRPLLLMLERRCIRQAAGFMTVSDGLADMLEDTFGRRPAVVRNVHDASLDRRLSEDDIARSRQRLGAGDDAIVLATVGNFKKGQVFGPLLAAMRKLPGDVHLMLIGAGYGRVSAEAADHGLSDRVHDFGAVAPGLIVPLLRAADVSAMTYVARSKNYAYALPNGFFQSIGAGLPLLYPALPEISALAKAHGLGIEVDPESETSWTAALRRVLGDRALRKELRGTVEAANDELNWARESGGFLKLVQSAVTAQSADPRGA